MSEVSPSSSARTLPGTQLPLAGVLHLLVVYIVWGSTYLAIRVAVRDGSGFPPFSMAASRVLLGGGLLWIWGAARRMRLRPTRAEWQTLIPSAALLWVGGNGAVVWASQRVDSVYAALLVGALPLWVSVFEAVLDRRAPSPLLALSLVVGFSGIAVISGPSLMHAEGAALLPILALLFASCSWGIGSILQQRRPVRLSPEMSSSYQQLIGGVLFVVVALMTREAAPTPQGSAWIAWAYLVLFGSLLAFTSFVKALRILEARVVMTYAYVNPVVAAFLGWWILHESITRWTIAGAVLVLLGVTGVFREREQRLG
ncbi:MAG: EamA family transporter [Candidatus Eisenbacteria bacterium]